MAEKVRELLRVGLLVGISCVSSNALAQTDFSQIEIKAIPVAGGVYMLMGAGGNIGVSAGEDGVFLIDDQFAPLNQKIVAAVSKISPKPIRFLLNTHWHGDHTGGNELMGKAGVLIVAHDNVRKRLSSEQFIEFFNSKTPPYPKVALPVVTFNDTVTLHYNREEIYAFHVPPAHTDGDAIVHFRRANVVHTGDIFSSAAYPFIDVGNGGSIDGMISATDRIISIVNGDTKIIPGHGPLGELTGLREYRAMLVAVRDNVLSAIRTGKTLDQILASKPTAEFEPRRPGGKPADDFVKLVYQDLSKNKVDGD